MAFEVERDVAWTKPVPAPDATSAEFWRGAARGELRIQRCPRCGHRQHYPRALCTACGAVPEFETARGTQHVWDDVIGTRQRRIGGTGDRVIVARSRS